MVAADDFGVKSVALTANGLPVATLEPGAVRVRVHARVRAHRRRRHAHGHDHGLLRPDEHGLDRGLGARDHDRDARDGQRLGPGDARADARPARELRRLHARHREDYTATTSANVVSTAGDALLSVVDPSTTAPGRLVNGTFSLPTPLQARARNAANTGTAYNAVSGSPLNLLTWAAPISNDAVSLEFQQSIAANDALRTGTYAKTLTYTLSTTAP